jgi:outer membrane protein OmpA-like peptidoglycan-associated protein
VAKGTLRLNYFIKPNFGIFAQGQYTRHFDSIQPAIYRSRQAGTLLINNLVEYELQAISATLGLTYTPGRYKKSETITKEEVKTNGKMVQKEVKVTVLDEQTGIPLYNAEVALIDEAGNRATATTGMDGVVFFPNLKPGAYTAEAMLNNIKSTIATVYKNDFDLPTQQIGVVVKHNDPRFTLLGFTTNKSTGQREQNVLVKLTNEQSKQEDMLLSKGSDAEFLFQLAANSDYSVYGKKENFISNIEKATTKGLNRSTTLYVNLEIGIEEAQYDKIISLKNIYYDLDKANVRTDASTDLIKLIRFMEDNPNAKIEIDSHTDSRGSDDYNQRLSQERANSVVNFLTNYGIPRSRMIAVGLGEKNLVNGCRNGVQCSEAEHQANRRTEFKVIR